MKPDVDSFAMETDANKEVTSEEEEVERLRTHVGPACILVPRTQSFQLSPCLIGMGRSGKLPSGVSAKLKRWKKGHSSDSNPVICRHRQAARSRFFSRPSGSRVAIKAQPGGGVLGRPESRWI